LRLYTIGVYGFDARSFFDALDEVGADLLLDLRRRRAVRGAHYSFANANRLIEQLETRGIAYRHVLDLAPDEATLATIHAAEKAEHRKASERTELPDDYVKRYRKLVLDRFDFAGLAKELKGYKAPVLLCVEGEPNACHRSLVAEALAPELGLKRVTHLRAGA
jgi:uncharacterized protein (DUF488 family)